MLSTEQRALTLAQVKFKWIAGDIPCGLATGLANEYNEKYTLH